MTADEMNIQLKKQNDELTVQLRALQISLDNLSRNFAMQTQLLAEANKRNAELTAKIEQLTERLNKNSKNSSKPPSSDGYKKPSPKSLRTSSGKRQGGQAGHKGNTLESHIEPTSRIPHMGKDCQGCPRAAECLAKHRPSETRNVMDAELSVSLTAHERYCIADCPIHHRAEIGEFPSDIKAHLQYGTNLQALVVALNTVGAVSVNRTHEILSSVFNIPLSTGTITAMVSRCAEMVTGTLDQIRDHLDSSYLIHCDETGTRVDGKTFWVHNASNELYTYLTLDRKRGIEGINRAGILPDYRGIIVHDCWNPYWKVEDVTHAVCCAHLLRELNGITENHPDQKWASRFRSLLLEMKKVRDKAVSRGRQSLSYYYHHKFDQNYDAIIQSGYDANPLPDQPKGKRGRKKRGKVLALIDRLKNLKASVCLFTEDFLVPFDNNQAERDIRMVKTKTKVSGCFRSEDGARWYLKIMSYVGTAKKHGLNAYAAITYALSGNPNLILLGQGS